MVAETAIPAGSAAKVHAGDNTIKLSHGMTATVKGLEVGTGYTITEDPGTDYNVSAKVNDADASLSNNGVSGTITSGQENTAAFTNTKRTKDVTFSKKAATGTEELPGAGLAVYKTSDVTTTDGVTTIKTGAVPVDSWISVDMAHEVKGVLEYEGSYVLIETSAPVGYAFADPIFFDIDVNGKVSTGNTEQADAVITMTDQPLHFTVNKVDSDNEEELSGAGLELFVKNGDGTDTKVNGAEWTSAENTTFDFGRMLEAGKDYILRETITPEGYRTIEDISVSVDRDGTITTSLEKDTDSDVYLVKNE
ncbi:MAG: SpaA isopeptide-forming pilin-related protein, partial [Firmicutes bacterium]|nr:SpaA isopeptide-forming pilin-related protein [Bacillota bacterium]